MYFIVRNSIDEMGHGVADHDHVYIHPGVFKIFTSNIAYMRYS